MNVKTRGRTKTVVLTATFTALIAAGAFVKIPIPMLPITLQFFFVNAAALILGKKWGTLAVGIYLVLGLIGLPIFTKGGGLFYVFEPTFGYLLGFLCGNFFAGWFLERSDRKKLKNLIAAGCIDCCFVYGLGLPYFYLISTFYLNNALGLKTLMIACFLSTVWSDLIFVFLTAFAVRKLDRILKLNQIKNSKRIPREDKKPERTRAEKAESVLKPVDTERAEIGTSDAESGEKAGK